MSHSARIEFSRAIKQKAEGIRLYPPPLMSDPAQRLSNPGIELLKRLEKLYQLLFLRRSQRDKTVRDIGRLASVSQYRFSEGE